MSETKAYTTAELDVMKDSELEHLVLVEGNAEALSLLTDRRAAARPVPLPEADRVDLDLDPEVFETAEAAAALEDDEETGDAARGIIQRLSGIFGSGVVQEATSITCKMGKQEMLRNCGVKGVDKMRDMICAGLCAVMKERKEKIEAAFENPIVATVLDTAIGGGCGIMFLVLSKGGEGRRHKVFALIAHSLLAGMVAKNLTRFDIWGIITGFFSVDELEKNLTDADIDELSDTLGVADGSLLDNLTGA